MEKHYDRSAHFLVGEGFLGEDALLPESKHINAGDAPTAAPPPVNPLDPTRAFKFGRMFEKRVGTMAELIGLQELGHAMNEMPQGLGVVLGKPKDDATIPSGYTYLGQFLTHEITFDETRDIPTSQITDLDLIEQGRTPSIDLDSVYGFGPSDSKHRALYYQDHARLSVGDTHATTDWNRSIRYDLPRGLGGSGDIKAAIPDPRNDENLALAQTHLAFIKFHNAVVDQLPAGVAAQDQFDTARDMVVRHFQWIVLKHFLPRIIDGNTLDCVVRSAQAHGLPKFIRDKVSQHGLFMPVEFSVAAFRVGHSIVRDTYEWNYFFNRSHKSLGPATILELFRRGGFSGDLDGMPRLESKWVIDWRRFYDFVEAGILPNGPAVNRVKKIDTNFNFQLNTVPGYPHPSNTAFRPLTVRNLIRGFMLGLPTGQQVADAIDVPRLTPDEIASGPHAGILKSYDFHNHTPLWYYVLKEAELNGGDQLGEVGSRIVAETMVAIIMLSPHSILRDGWTPTLGGRTHQQIFDMVDLLKFTETINPTPDG